jgi:hypothetical protein
MTEQMPGGDLRAGPVRSVSSRVTHRGATGESPGISS